MMNKTKAQGLPINILVMMIIGIVIFGLGIGLFSKISKSSDSKIDDLKERIQTDISELQCSGEDWICVPSLDVSSSKSKLGYISIGNREDTTKFKIEIYNSSGTQVTSSDAGISNTCGKIEVYIPDMTNGLTVKAGTSTNVPIEIINKELLKSKCSFTLLLKLEKRDDTGGQYQEIDKTPLIINVE